MCNHFDDIVQTAYNMMQVNGIMPTVSHGITAIEKSAKCFGVVLDKENKFTALLSLGEKYRKQ